MNKNKWTSTNPKEFKIGDIICNKNNQSFLRLVLGISDEALWVSGLILCALTSNEDIHPIYPIFFDEVGEDLLRLGNLKDFQRFVDDENIQKEIKRDIEKSNKIRIFP